MNGEYSFDFRSSDNNSEIVAHVVTGKNKGKNIYLNKEHQSDIENDKTELLYEFVMESKIRMTQKKLDKLTKAVLDEEEPEDEDLQNLYKRFNASLKKSNEILLKDSQLEIVPYQGDDDNVQRDVMFIGACAGAGKTTFIASYCKYFNKLYPTSPIWLLSCKPLEDEKAYEGVKRIKQVDISEENLQSLVDNGGYLCFKSKSGRSLVIFDDFDAIGKKQEKLIDILLNSILQVGRSSRIYCIVSKHSLNSGHKTKIVWSESNKIVIFPNGLSRYSLVYAMKQYIGLDHKMIDKILAHKSRWVCIQTHLPRYFITQNSLAFI